MTEHIPEVGPIVKAARDLSAIIEMAPHLDDQAEAKANATMDGRSLPGGLAMVALAPVANIEAWEHQYETAERMGRDTTWIEDEDATWEPPLMTLRFWSDAWRAEHNADYGQRPTVHSEASFIKASLNWAWDHEPAFDDFCADIRRARVRLENVLYAGERAQRGAPCMYDECNGARLQRKHEPYRDESGEKSWRMSNWHCPKCKRSWDNERYLAQVAAANWAAQAEDVEGETWCSVRYASRQTGVPETTIRAWVTQTKKADRPVDIKHPIRTACIILGRRMVFVSLADVVARRDRPRRHTAA